MKLLLTFENSGDEIPFLVHKNHDLIRYFVNKCNENNNNSFYNLSRLSNSIDQKLTQLHWAISKTNEVLYSLVGYNFEQKMNLVDYFEQDFLNKTHSIWVKSQQEVIDIDELRMSSNHDSARLGNILHEVYPDEIRQVKLAPILEKLGYLYPYEEVNMGVHRLESSFNNNNMSFENSDRYQVFDNPFLDSMESTNEVCNFSFSYTFVGRQYHDKFKNFDLDLICDDFYNFETMEYSFNINLENPESIPYSPEFIEWATNKNVPLVSEQIPVANIENLYDNLVKYRIIFYRNSNQQNKLRLDIQE